MKNGYRDQTRKFVTGYFRQGTDGIFFTWYVCQGPNRKICNRILLSGNEPENYLQGTSVRDRIGKFVTG